MRTASRIALVAAAASHLLAACATQPVPPADIGTMDFADTRPAAILVGIVNYANAVSIKTGETVAAVGLRTFCQTGDGVATQADIEDALG